MSNQKHNDVDFLLSIAGKFTSEKEKPFPDNIREIIYTERADQQYNANGDIYSQLIILYYFVLDLLEVSGLTLDHMQYQNIVSDCDSVQKILSQIYYDEQEKMQIEDCVEGLNDNANF